MTITEARAIFFALAEEYDRDHPRGPMRLFAEWLVERDLTPEQIEAIGMVMRRKQLIDEELSDG
jgi:hypothetical protein